VRAAHVLLMYACWIKNQPLATRESAAFRRKLRGKALRGKIPRGGRDLSRSSPAPLVLFLLSLYFFFIDRRVITSDRESEYRKYRRRATESRTRRSSPRPRHAISLKYGIRARMRERERERERNRESVRTDKKHTVI